MLRLVEPWFQTNRVVCADSFVASVQAAEALFKKGMKFTGVVKTATEGFPMSHLSRIEMSGKGQHLAMVSKSPGGPDLMALVWTDRDRRYFISSTGTTNPGNPIYRERWRTNNGVTRQQQMSINIPEVCEQYYETCSQIDRHNRCRRDDLGLEKKFEVKDWSMRVNTSLLAICIVDSWKLYLGARANSNRISPNQFYSELAEGLIENKMDKMTLRQRDSDSDAQDFDIEIGSGVGTHLTPTNRKHKSSGGSNTSAICQSRCSECKGTEKSKFICSASKMYLEREGFLCHHQTGVTALKSM